MVRACSTYCGEQKCIQGFDRKTEGNKHLEDLRIYRQILKGMLKK
jgi:hypothetical protein